MLIQGDSRRFSEIVQAQGIVTSPPFMDARQDTTRATETGGGGPYADRLKTCLSDYGKTPGQIGALKSGDLAGVVTSPPFGDVDTKPTKMGSGKGTRETGQAADRNKGDYHYPDSDGQIGTLKIDGLVTSPPWEDREGSLGAHKFKDAQTAAKRMSQCRGHASSPQARMDQLMREEGHTYGNSDGQIGKDSGETYWQAMAQVYRECFKSLKFGGYMAVVIKDYVKNKRRVPLCMQTLKLLIHTGFEPVERIKAMLVKEDRQPGLFGVDIVTKKERKSFFRRLAEKNGSPRIDWEEVLIVRK